jgi:pyruvate,water dikinase
MSALRSTHPFLLPSETERYSGADAIQGMYPYFTQFRPEDDDRFWFYNKMHFPEPMPAFDAITAEGAYAGLGVMVTRMFAVPTSKGFEHRIVNGRIYIAANSVTDPEEIGRRVKEFEDRAFFYFGNWERLYGEWHQRIMGLIRGMEALAIPQLGEFDSASVVKEGRGFSEGQLLVQAYDQAIENYFLMWQYHSEFLILGYGAYLTFFEFCKKAFPEIEDRTIANMVAGVDSLMFRPDDELKRLAALAVDLGIASEFKESADAEQILSRLARAGNAGREWLDDFEKTRDPWFNTSMGDGFYHHHRRWNDDLRVPFAALINYVSQIKSGKSLERPTAELRAQRERIISEYRGLLDSDADRAVFDQMLGLSHQVFPYVEDHKFYCEHWLTGAFFNKIREFARLLCTHGLLDEPEDVFHLNHGEVREALSDLRLAWSIGGDIAGRNHWQPIIAARKKALKELSK